MAVKRTETVRVRMWEGSPDDLRTLAAAITEAMADSALDGLLADDKRQALLGLVQRTGPSRAPETYTGSTDILDDGGLDLHRLTQLLLRAGDSRVWIKLELIRRELVPDDKLVIEGPTAWAQKHRGPLENLLRRRRPPYYFVRAPWFAPLLTLLTMVLTRMLLYHLTEPDGYLYGFWWFIVGGGAVLLALPAYAAITYLVPAFELVPEGAKSRSRAALGIIGGFLAEVLLAVVFWLL